MIPILFEEALARLADGDPIEVSIERVPNNGVTHVQKMPRDYVIARLRNNQTYETGEVGQSMDTGINIITIASPTGNPEHIGLCMIFFKTKPECRLNKEQLAESLKRGHGEALFSTKATAE